MATVSKPSVIGAAIAVVDSAQLAATPTDGLTIGSKAFNEDVGAYFTLTISTASPVTDQVVAAAGISNGRWILDVEPLVGTVLTLGATTLDEAQLIALLALLA